MLAQVSVAIMASLLLRSMYFLILLCASVRGQELPKRDAGELIDFEPQLMLRDLPEEPFPASRELEVDLAKLQASLEKARKNAAVRERLCKAGVLSKMEAEQGALKVVRLVKELEAARLQAVIREVEAKRERATTGEISAETISQAESELAAASTAATDSAKKWKEAQRAAAELRLQRERRLLAAGAGSRSAVKRAEAALNSLAARPNP